MAGWSWALGGGYSDEEFRAFGLGMPSPCQNIDGLEDAIRITRALWTTEDVTIEGRVHRTEHARIEPKPNGTTPIWLGTYGHRALEVTGRLADGWIPSLGFAPPDAVDAMREEALAAAKEAGRDPGQIACVYNVEVPGSMTARRSEPRSSRVPPAPSSNGC